MVQLTRSDLPSMASLRAIEALDRLKTASAVAKELSQTQSAVSRQLQLLEQQLGQDIITRRNNRLELTPKAKEFAETIRTALGMIQSATQDLQFEDQANTLTLGILPAFGMRWLMPKLGDFSKQHPDITINMLTRLVPFNFDAEPIDAALHFGDAEWANTSSMRLKSEYVVPVCRPDYFDEPPTSDRSPRPICCKSCRAQHRGRIGLFNKGLIRISNDLRPLMISFQPSIRRFWRVWAWH